MKEAFIFDGLRTPIGRNTGALAHVRPDDLAGLVIAGLLQKHRLDGQAIEDVVLGCSNQAGEDSRNVARHAALLAGLGEGVAGMTVNRLCGSGLAAVLDASRMAAVGDGDLFIAGGVESMSRGPFAIAKAEQPFSRDFHVYDTSIGARFPNSRLEAAYGCDTMPQTAENIARELAISREDADAYAFRSQQRYAAALKDGFFAGEILPVAVPTGRGEKLEVTEDEHPRPGSTKESLARLRALHEGGVVTAGNASGINDGAAALLIGTLNLADRYGLNPRARLVSSGVSGIAPRLMGLGPVSASNKALQRAGLSLSDMDVIEINEAFASQVLGCLKLFALAEDDPRVNPNGGAIALGHPLGMSGARILLTALRELERRNGRYALVSMCIGVGQGIAAVLERTE